MNGDKTKQRMGTVEEEPLSTVGNFFLPLILFLTLCIK